MKLTTLAFCCGAFVMALQILGSRILAPFFGNSLTVWGSLIALFLSALSAGYWLGGSTADKRPSLSLLGGIILAAGTGILLLPFIALPITYFFANFALLGPRYQPFATAVVLFGLPSMLLGMVSPFIIRLAAEHPELAGRAAGNIYAISTSGSVLGTLLTSFYVIELIGVRAAFFVLGGGLVILAFWALEGAAKAAVLLPIAITGALVPLVPHDPSWYLPAEMEGTVEYETDSAYAHLMIFDVPQPNRTVRFMVADKGAQGRWCLDLDPMCDLEYMNFLFLGPVYRPNPEHVAVIGLGAGLLPVRLIDAYPDIRIDSVEIDQKVYEAAIQYGPFEVTERQRVFIEDGRQFLSKRETTFDIIYLDAFTGTHIPVHLATREYFELIRNRLKPGGVLCMNYIGRLEGEGARLTRSMVKTLSSVFEQVDVYAVDQQPCDRLDATKERNIIFFGTNAPIEQRELRRRLPEVMGRIDLPYLRVTLNRLCEDLTLGDDAVIYTDDFAPVNLHREQRSR